MEEKKVIDSLKACANHAPCTECHFNEYSGDDICECTTMLAEEALKLIEFQEGLIEDYRALNILRNKRVHYRRFIEEVWKKEHGELSEPDFDEIYKRYFEQQEEIKLLKQNRANIFEIMEAVERGRAKGIKELRGEIVEQLEVKRAKMEGLKKIHPDNSIVDVYIDGEVNGYNYAIDLVKGATNDRKE